MTLWKGASCREGSHGLQGPAPRQRRAVRSFADAAPGESLPAQLPQRRGENPLFQSK